MSDPNQNIWLYASITLASIADGSTRTIKVSNRPIFTGTFGDFFPILKDVSRLQSALDTYSVMAASGSIVLADHIGSFAYERKFSDLFERETIVDQQIEIYKSETELDSNTPSWGLIFRGYALNARREGGQLEIAIESRAFERRYVNLNINTTDFPSAPTSSIGQVLPLVLGTDVEVKPILISPLGDSSPSYAYATTMPTHFKSGGVQNYYARDASNLYSEVISVPTNASTKVFGTTSHDGTESSSFNSPFSGAWQIDTYSSSTHYIIKGGVIRFEGHNNGGGTYSGTIDIALYASKPNEDLPDKPLAQTTITQVNYTASFASNTTFEIEFSFNVAVPLTNTRKYWLYLKYNQGGSTYSYVNVRVYSSTTVQWAGKIGDSGFSLGSVFSVPCYSLYGVYIIDSPLSSTATSEGLGSASFELTQRGAPAYQSDPDLTALDLIVKVDGLIDVNGTINGSAFSVLEWPHHQVEALSYKYNGSSWAANTTDWDFTTYDSTHAVFASGHLYERKTSGATSGLTLLEQLITDIAKNSASRIGYTNEGKLAFYAWGLEQSPQMLVSQDIGKITSLEILDQSFILNSLRFAYGRQLTSSVNLAALINQGFATDSIGTLTWTVGTSALSTHLIGTSQTNFDERFLLDSSFQYIQNSTAAELLARFFLARFNLPAQYVDIELPLADGDTLKLLDVVRVQSPELPAYYGTSYNADPSHYEGYPADPGLGEVLTRAQTYRAQIEGRAIEVFNDRGPTLILRCKLLLNYPKDPT